MEKLLKNNIIQESKSHICSTAFLVPKRSGIHRLVVDFRKLNQYILIGRYPPPRISDILLHLRNASTKMMKNIGYWKWYKYAHDYENAKVEQEHFPDKLKGRKYIN